MLDWQDLSCGAIDVATYQIYIYIWFKNEDF